MLFDQQANRNKQAVGDKIFEQVIEGDRLRDNMEFVNREQEGGNISRAKDELFKAVQSTAKNPEEMTESQKMISCNTQTT